MTRVPLVIPAVLLAVAAACGGDTTGPSSQPSCGASTSADLAIGGMRLVDPIAETNCVDLPGGPDDREYLVVPYAGTGQEAPAGVQGSFQLRSERPAAAATGGALLAPAAARGGVGSFPLAFDQSLRLAEHALATGPVAAASRALLAGEAAVQAPPTIGEEAQFNVCKALSCSSTVSVTATVRYVGSEGVIYVDNDMPAGAQQLTADDITRLGTLFDEYLFPIDTTAFGTISDINADQKMAIVITDQVNDLTPDCTNGRVVGYFFGGDLLPSYPGSNRREVFFAFAPKPSTSTCPAVTRAGALRSLPPVLIHELQHMISFNQHVLRRGGSDEAVWLNEALSHFSEDLGGRLIPDAECPNSSSCFSQFSTGNITNGYQFLEDPESSWLIAPSTAGPTLAERGAGWLFVRWLADHFSADTLRGTQLTRGLLGSSTTGATSVAATTGQPFATLVGEWLLANWTENLPGFAQTGLLRYRTWNLRATYAANSPGLFERPYPLVPDSTDGHSVHNGSLRAGSGHYLRVVVPAGVATVQVSLTGQSGTLRIDAGLTPRIAVVRIR